MSVELLAQLQERSAFDPAPRHDALYEVHVPFDEITGATGCEGALNAAIRSGRRVALVGPAGAGKSSVTAHVLGPLVEGLAPLLVPVAVGVDGSDIATDQRAFARHLLGLLRRQIGKSLPDRAGRPGLEAPRRQRQVTSTRRATMGPPWLTVELSREIQAVLDDTAETARELLEQVRDVLAVVTEAGLRPVLVLDDTDKWINSPWQPDVRRIRAGFFGSVIRVIAEDLSAAAVVAVHDSYRGDPAYEAAQGFLDTTVDVPPLTSSAAVERILARRVELSLDGAQDTAWRLLHDDALDALFAHYADGATRNIRRRVLYIAHAALTEAVDAQAEQIRAEHVHLAIQA